MDLEDIFTKMEIVIQGSGKMDIKKEMELTSAKTGLNINLNLFKVFMMRWDTLVFINFMKGKLTQKLLFLTEGKLFPTRTTQNSAY